MMSNKFKHLKQLLAKSADSKYAGGGEVKPKQSKERPKDDVPDPIPEKAKAFVKGATSGGPSTKEMWENLKTGLGFSKGEKVPGRAVVKGDSEKNDIVPAALSPGEVVVPRSKVSASNEEILEFIRNAKKSKK